VNYLADVTKANLQLDNVTTSPILVTGGQITRSNNTNVIAPTSGSIQIQPGKSYIPTVDVANIAAAVRDVSLAGSTLGNIVKETGIRVVSSL
jgi:hypothetical protein